MSYTDSGSLIRMMASVRLENKELTSRVTRLEELVGHLMAQRVDFSGTDHHQILSLEELRSLKEKVSLQPPFRCSLVCLVLRNFVA